MTTPNSRQPREKPRRNAANVSRACGSDDFFPIFGGDAPPFPSPHIDRRCVEIARKICGGGPLFDHGCEAIENAGHDLTIRNVSRQVNTKRIGPDVVGPATKRIAMVETPNGRLKRARSAAGYKTAADFAKAHGFAEPTYRSAENGNRGLKLSAAKIYAKALGVTWQYLMEGEEKSDALTAAIIGYVGAGEVVTPLEDDHAWDAVPCPPGLKSGLAAIVKGKSMEPVYRDKDMLFFEKRETTEHAILGRDCLVQVHEGPRLIKGVRRGKRRGFFRLYSYADGSESEDLKIEWAAPVKWVKRS